MSTLVLDEAMGLHGFLHYVQKAQGALRNTFKRSMIQGSGLRRDRVRSGMRVVTAGPWKTEEGEQANTTGRTDQMKMKNGCFVQQH